MKNYKITIKAKEGYNVRTGHESGSMREIKRLRDGNEIIMDAYAMTYEDFLDNMEDNEMFTHLETFKTIKGNKFIYARDNEINEDYLIKIPT